MKISRRLISFLLLLFGVAQATATGTCDETEIGSMPMTFSTNTPRNTSGLSGLFLNIIDRSLCSGNVTAWDFCYYINVTQSSRITIQAGVWRESGEYYTLVNNSLIDLPIPEPQLGFQFVCRHWALSECQDEPIFEVQEGDIVGMYVNDTSDDNMVHILGTPPDTGTTACTLRFMDITSINNVLNSTSNSVGYSLYLVAVLGDGSEMATCPPPPTTTKGISDTTSAANAAPDIPTWAIVVICVLGVAVLLLIIMIVAVLCRLCHLNRIKGSGPVLITRLNHRKRIAHNGPASSNTELNSNLENVRSQQPLCPPPLLNEAEPLTAPDQGGVASSLSGTQSPPPVLFVIGFDNDQQARDGQDEAMLKQPNLRNKNSPTKAQKVALLPKLDLRRSRSAAEAMNLPHTNTPQTTNDLLTSSSEYPYVVHSFEVIEKDRDIAGSLPNLLQFARKYPASNFKSGLTQENACDEDTSTGIIPYANVRVNGSATDFHDDEPAYSYTDRRELMQNGNFHYEEYPSDWMHAAQELTNPEVNCNMYDDCQSPDYQDIDDYQEIDDSTPTKTRSESAVQSSNHASPLKQSSVKENNTLPLKSKAKPPIRPRKKLTQIVTPSNPATQPSRSIVKHSSSTDKTDDSDNLNAQTPNKYMKLLSLTRDDFQAYTYLQNGTTDTDSEQADPNQSSEQ